MSKGIIRILVIVAATLLVLLVLNIYSRAKLADYRQQVKSSIAMQQAATAAAAVVDKASESERDIERDTVTVANKIRSADNGGQAMAIARKALCDTATYKGSAECAVQ